VLILGTVPFSFVPFVVVRPGFVSAAGFVTGTPGFVTTGLFVGLLVGTGLVVVLGAGVAGKAAATPPVTGAFPLLVAVPELVLPLVVPLVVPLVLLCATARPIDINKINNVAPKLLFIRTSFE
jgi:hypothetical protein